MKPRVSIIVVNWNKRADVLHLLDSLRGCTYDNFSVVVVDNASTDGSVEAIRSHLLPVILIENEENLGGTGGFNTGMRYALSNFQQDYLWLLDNDAEVLPDTLSRLVAAMEADSTIGIAGSGIIAPEDHDLVVEAGAFLDWSGRCLPHLRYQTLREYNGPAIIDVDTVAACSALVRDSIVRSVGVMDERFFLHWDDIDFCIRINRAGHRVVAVIDAPVYHGAEKGYSPITLYYDFRNALLFHAKHLRGVPLANAFRRILGSYLASAAYMLLLKKKEVALYAFSGCVDFIKGRFGRAGVPPADLLHNQGGSGETTDSSALSPFRKMLVFGVGSFADVERTLVLAREAAPQASVSLAVAADRAGAYDVLGFDEVIPFDLFRGGILVKLKAAWSLVMKKFDCGITAGSGFVVPFAFLLPRNFIAGAATTRVAASDVSWWSIWKVPAAVVAGSIAMAVVLLPALAVSQTRKETDGVEYEVGA